MVQGGPGHGPVDFAAWVRSRRVAAMLTQEQLAGRAGLSVRTVRSVEAGSQNGLRLETRRLLLATLGAPTTQTVEADPSTAAAASAVTAVPAQLPADIAGFAGRTDLLCQLDQLVTARQAAASGPMVISALAGMPGVGKSALAVHWAHQVRELFPDGQLYVDLRGFTVGAASLRPVDALAQFLRALGVSAEQVPAGLDASVALYRSLLADRRMLILLDNAQSAEQVRPMLPGGGKNLVLITTRDRLSALIARDGAVRFTTGVLSSTEALELLEGVLGPERVAAELEAATELTELCGYLPLALRIVATALQDQPLMSISEYTERLRPNVLGGLVIHDDPHFAVRAAFDLSYTALPERARWLFRRLSLLPTHGFTTESAAVAADLDLVEAAEVLDLLVRAHLIEKQTPGRFTCHSLLRLYASAGK